ncbi:MAG: UbiA family prenyltransferase, partial [Acidobacteriota bacterium]
VNLGSVPALAWWAALPIGCLATAFLVVNNVRDCVGDRQAGKGTLVARFGRAAGMGEYALLLALTYLTPAWLFVQGAAPWVLLPLITVPRAALLLNRLARDEGRALNATLIGTARLMVLYGLLLTAGIAIGFDPGAVG